MRAVLITIVAGVGGLLAFWLRPWADSVMTARVTVVTDGSSPEVVYETHRRFSERTGRAPVFRADIDLRRYAGQLIRFDVEGETARRELKDSSTGYVACSAELVTGEGRTPIEFVGWQQGAEIGLHPGPVGPQVQRLGDGEDRGFAFARKGTLWHALRVPEGALLRLSLKPAPAVRLEVPPVPYIPVLKDADPPVQVPAARREEPPDVFIYLIDALRADHLGCYGYDRDTSPEIDAFAGDSTLYSEAFAPTTWTRPSVATILSGLYPSVHGAMHNTDGLAKWPVLLPEILHDAGYATACFTTNLQIGENFGFNQGWDRFLLNHFAPASWTVAQTADFLKGLPPERRAFVYLHTIEPHDPYTPRPETFAQFDRGYRGKCDGSTESLNEVGRVNPHLSADDIAHLVDLYDGEVRDADSGFGQFLDMLRKTGRYEGALIIVVADHGEAFDEHGALSHGRTLNIEEMHVPLIVHYPDGVGGGTKVEERVGLQDLLPTILAQVGERPKLTYRLEGRDVQAAASGTAGDGGRFYAELSQFGGNEIDLVGVIDEDGYKRVVDVSALPRDSAAKGSLGLWATRDDPQEKTDLSAKLPARAAYDEQLIAGWLLGQKLRRERTAQGPPPRVEIDEGTREKLRALGYVGNPNSDAKDDRP